MNTESISALSWEDWFLAVDVTIFFLLAGAGLFLAWRSREKD